VLAVLAALAAGCERGTDASSGSANPSSASSTSDPPADLVVPEGFDRTVARLASAGIDGVVVDLDVWFADEPAQRHEGLTDVTDLGGADGMLFAFDAAGEHRFYMWQTPMPLDIYFFDEEQRFVSSETMEPCREQSSAACDRYSPDVPFLLAVEVPAGSLDELDIDGAWTISFVPPVAGASIPPISGQTDR
jgi:uncharacterized membrane protein (UPF0127 family)